MYTIEIIGAAGQVRQSAAGETCARLYYPHKYQKGDRIVFNADARHCAIQVDQTLPEALVFLPESRFIYTIPQGGEKTMYAPQAFAGKGHVITLRPAFSWELKARRNIAFNPMDQRFYEGCYPHASANVETRDEPQFFARNVIDGVKCNHLHGHWPFQSWGIGGRADAAITLHFGRPVQVDEVGITLRADFPHDSWWISGTLTLSNGHQVTLHFEKTGDTQYFPTGSHLVEWVRLSDLIKADTPSPFPALTAFEVFGQDP